MLDLIFKGGVKSAFFQFYFMNYFDTKLGRAFNADCFDVMATMPDGCVDMILADLPYGTTACKWDTVISFDKLWKELNRICKPNAAIILTASQPFTSVAVMSNIKQFRHQWVWYKKVGSNVFQAKTAPLRVHEDVLVFSKEPCVYFPQMIPKDKPQMQGTYKTLDDGSGVTNKKGKQALAGKIYSESYPKTIQTFEKERRSQKPIHPTQKPVALFEYLIKTYTKEGMLVFDPTAGSLTTGVAAENLSRRWVCCEMLEEYFTKGEARFI